MASPTPSSASAKAKPAGRPYLSDGQVLSTPPVTARINNVITSVYNTAGLYITTLFSFDPYTAAMNSDFNTMGPGRNPTTGRQARSSNTAASWLGMRGNGNTGNTNNNGGSGGSGGSGGNGGGPRRMGTVDDVRAPECGSCR